MENADMYRKLIIILSIQSRRYQEVSGVLVYNRL